MEDFDPKADIVDSAPMQIFCSYSRANEELCEELVKYMSVLERSGTVKIWRDRKIPAGNKWEEEIRQELKKSRIMLLLISADFLASKYCLREMELAFSVAQGLRIVPVILKDADWQNYRELGKLQAIPKDGKPVVEWPIREKAWMDVVNSIREICAKFEPANAGKRIKDGTHTTPHWHRSRGKWLGSAITLSAIIAVLLLFLSFDRRLRSIETAFCSIPAAEVRGTAPRSQPSDYSDMNPRVGLVADEATLGETDSRIRKELQRNDLAAKIRAARTWSNTHTDQGNDRAFHIYSEVISNLSRDARTVLNPLLIAGAIEDSSNGDIAGAVQKYEKVFAAYMR
jgi:hypothetical protein